MVDIERSNDDHVWWDCELTSWDRNTTQVVNNDVDVVFQLCRDWNDWSCSACSRRETLLDIVLLLDDLNLVFHYNINLVLQHDDVLETHDVNSNQMLSRLWLWIRLISCDEQECSVHNSCTSQHRSHESIVTWAINKRDMPVEYHISVAAFDNAFNVVRLE